MEKIKRIIFASLLLPLGCLAGDGFVIRGKVTGVVSGYVSVITHEPVDGAPAHPSMPEQVRIVNGEFSYSGKIDRPDLVLLKVSTKKISIVLENADYELNCSFDSLSGDKVKGGAMNEQYWAFRKSNKQPLEYLTMHNKEELAPWLAFYYLRSREDVTAAEKLLTPEGKASANGRLFMNRVETFIRTAPGTPFPALQMTDANGKPFLLKDMAGKVVVFDFWASWCAPCIAYIPKLREHYNRFKDRDVVFVSVSVDEDTVKWKKAMTEQGMEWKQVLAQGAFRSGEGIRKLFNISGIPYVIVVDKQGKIAASLDYIGKEKLAEVLGVF